jgi:hypothetical protein
MNNKAEDNRFDGPSILPLLFYVYITMSIGGQQQKALTEKNITYIAFFSLYIITIMEESTTESIDQKECCM